MEQLRRSQISVISGRPGNEVFALKIAFGAFLGLGLFCIVFYGPKYIRCEIFMLVSNFARSMCIFTLRDRTIRASAIHSTLYNGGRGLKIVNFAANKGRG